jgi:hypothetical protein
MNQSFWWLHPLSPFCLFCHCLTFTIGWSYIGKITSTDTSSLGAWIKNVLSLYSGCLSSRTVFRNLFSLAAHPDLSKTHEGTSQNVASRKGGTKLYMTIHESLTAEREQVQKIHNMSFRHLGILLLQKNTKMAKTRIVNFCCRRIPRWRKLVLWISVTEEYQDGKNSYCEFLLQKNTKMAKTRIVNFSDLFPFCSKWFTYVSAKYLPYKNAGIWKQNITHVG